MEIKWILIESSFKESLLEDFIRELNGFMIRLI